MNKSPDAFRTISEVADWLDVPKHVLRFWESKFAQVKPVKRAGGRRYYRPADMELLGGIKRLLHDDGLTIRGVQKLLREEGVRHVAGMSLVVVDPCDHDGTRFDAVEDDAADRRAAPDATAREPEEPDLPGPDTMPREEPDSERVDVVLDEAAPDAAGHRPSETDLPEPNTMPREEPDPERVDAVLDEAAEARDTTSSPVGDATAGAAAGPGPDDDPAFDMPLDLVTPAPPVLADLLRLDADAFARAGVDPAPILDQARALARSMDRHG